MIYNLKRYNLFRKEKLAVLTFHLSFIIILIGSGRVIENVCTPCVSGYIYLCIGEYTSGVGLGAGLPSKVHKH